MDLPNDNLWAAFQDGGVFTTDSGDVVLNCIDAGALAVPSGRIAAFDLWDMSTTTLFSVRVLPDEYPMFLAVDANAGVALSMIQLRDVRPVRWIATELAAFSVDSAIVCFADGSLSRRIGRAKAAKHEALRKSVEDAMLEHDDLWGSLTIRQNADTNILALRPFGGDGTFLSYVGHTADDQPACIVTDYFLRDCAREPVGT